MKRTVFALALGLLIGSAGTAVAANTDTVQATLAKFFVQVGTGKAQEVTAVVIDGTSYYPIRTIANMLGQDVDYSDETRTIILTPKTEAKNMNETAQSQQINAKIGDTIEFTGAKIKITNVEYTTKFGNIGLYKNNHFAVLTLEYYFEPNDKIDLRRVTIFFDSSKNVTLPSLEFVSENRLEMDNWLNKNAVPNKINTMKVGFQIKNTSTLDTVYLKNPLNKNETAVVSLVDQ